MPSTESRSFRAFREGIQESGKRITQQGYAIRGIGVMERMQVMVQEENLTRAERGNADTDKIPDPIVSDRQQGKRNPVTPVLGGVRFQRNRCVCLKQAVEPEYAAPVLTRLNPKERWGWLTSIGL